VNDLDNLSIDELKAMLPFDKLLRWIVETDEPDDQWLARISLLSKADIPVNAKNLSRIGGCSIDLALGAMGGLVAKGYLEEA
jgi:hypothetical protein